MTIKWSDELMQDICDHLSTGKSMLDIAKLQGYPSADSLYRQMARDANFAAQCARAREAGQDFQADECVRIADEATPETAQVAKVRISARQWRAMKLAPKVYGEKQQVELSGTLGVKAEQLGDDDLARIASSGQASVID